MYIDTILYFYKDNTKLFQKLRNWEKADSQQDNWGSRGRNVFGDIKKGGMCEKRVEHLTLAQVQTGVESIPGSCSLWTPAARCGGP